jgi:prevent-host-death family protein
MKMKKYDGAIGEANIDRRYLQWYDWRYIRRCQMGKMPNIIPITDLRQDAAGVLQRVRASREPIVITQRGRAAAVMVSAEEYERAEHEREILMLLARGEKEIKEGKGHDLETVLAEAYKLLKEG